MTTVTIAAATRLVRRRRRRAVVPAVTVRAGRWRTRAAERAAMVARTAERRVRRRRRVRTQAAGTVVTDVRREGTERAMTAATGAAEVHARMLRPEAAAEVLAEQLHRLCRVSEDARSTGAAHRLVALVVLVVAVGRLLVGAGDGGRRGTGGAVDELAEGVVSDLGIRLVERREESVVRRLQRLVLGLSVDDGHAARRVSQQCVCRTYLKCELFGSSLRV